MYCLYLRKSRKDLEAEAHGEGETLARHKAQLLALARRMGLSIGETYPEVVTGETIAARPEMQRLLRDVEAGMWDGVLVMEVERLARGDTIDQGLVAQTFKYSNTKIVTPAKTYDPANEYDEEYFEFGLFMSRREYTTIKRRMKAGMVASSREGNYTGNVAPYGYERIKNTGKGWTLAPFEPEAAVVRSIFDWYVNGDESGQRLGTSLIARKLNTLCVQPRKSDVWVSATIQGLLANPIYAGKIAFGRRKGVRKMADGKIAVIRPRAIQYDVFEGKHPALISEELFNRTQAIRKSNCPPPLPADRGMVNPLAGLLVCGICGRKMVLRKYSGKQRPTAMCPVTACSNVSAPFDLVEQRLLEAMNSWLTTYRLSIGQDKRRAPRVELHERSLAKLRADLVDLRAQRDRVFVAFERGVYDDAVFLERSQQIAADISSAERSIQDVEAAKINAEREHCARAVIGPKIEYLLSVYDQLPDAQSKNVLLKEVLEKVVYKKVKRAGPHHGDPGDFQLDILIRFSDAY